MRTLSTLAVAILGLSALGFSQTADPTGFCPPPPTVAACTTANGPDGETIGIANTTFGMEKNGGGTSQNPWFLIVAIPDGSGAAPTITSSSFTITAPASGLTYLPTSKDLYTFTGTNGDNSMNAANMFGSDEAAAFGSTPANFDVFVYTVTGTYTHDVPYTFTVAGTGLPAGTFLAASSGDGTAGFSTPFTTAGLVDGPGCNGTNGCTAGPGGGPRSSTPEPVSVFLFGTAGLGALLLRKKSRAA